MEQAELSLCGVTEVNLNTTGGSFVSGGDYKLVPNFTKIGSGVFVAGLGVAGIKINHNTSMINFLMVV